MGVDTSKMTSKARAQYEHARGVVTSAGREALNQLIEARAAMQTQPYAYHILRAGDEPIGVVLVTLDPKMIAPVIGFAAEANCVAHNLANPPEPEPVAPGSMALADPSEVEKK